MNLFCLYFYTQSKIRCRPRNSIGVQYTLSYSTKLHGRRCLALSAAFAIHHWQRSSSADVADNFGQAPVTAATFRGKKQVEDSHKNPRLSALVQGHRNIFSCTPCASGVVRGVRMLSVADHHKWIRILKHQMRKYISIPGN